MRNFPHSPAGMIAGLMAAPIVFLLVWLFNAHRMGKLKTAKRFFISNRWLMLIILGFILFFVILFSWILL